MIKTKYKSKFQYICANWKVAYHLVMRTNRFGVNNRWWEKFDSIAGIPLWRQAFNILRIAPLIRSYKFVKWRAAYCSTLHPAEYRLLWGKHPMFTNEEIDNG